MIRKITLENFFSFKDEVTIELNPGINILVGINGSGKSTLLKAIRLLSEITSGNGIESLIQKEWGGFNQIVNTNSGNAEYIKLKYEFDASILNSFNATRPFKTNPTYEIIIWPLGSTNYYIEERFFSLNINKKNNQSDPFYYLSFQNGKGLLSERGEDGRITYNKDQTEMALSGQESVLKQVSDPMRYLQLYTLKSAIEQTFVYDYFNTSPSSSLRKPADFSTQHSLNRNGDNLAPLLSKIKNSHSLTYDAIQKVLNNANPNFQSVEFNFFGNQIYLSIKEKNLNRTVGASHISDGTLRFLLYATMLLNPDRGALLCIDEPENGLHPDMINTIAQLLKDASQKTQLIIATHSPLLLNCFELEDILVFEKDVENVSVVLRKNENDFSDWEGEFIPGQMWLRGQLGGKRW